MFSNSTPNYQATSGQPSFGQNVANHPWLSSTGLAGLGLSGLGMFNSNINPADAAAPYYQAEQRDLPQYYQPYIQQGQQAGSRLQGAYQSMMDPNAFIKQIGAGYQKSPGYDWQVGQGQQAVNNAAAAGGMLGSPQNQQQSAAMTEGLANQDYYNYLSHALNTYSQGLQGEQGLYNTGAEASMGLGQNIADLTGQQGQLAYRSAEEQNKSKSDLWGDLFSGVGAAAKFLG